MYEFFTTTNLGIILLTTGQVLLIVVPLLVALAFILWADRKVWAAVQLRKAPTTFGPFLSCTAAQTFRSAQRMKASATRSGTTIRSTCPVVSRMIPRLVVVKNSYIVHGPQIVGIPFSWHAATVTSASMVRTPSGNAAEIT